MNNFPQETDPFGRPMEILLIEDSLLHARLAIGMLKQGNFKHRVTIVRDGDEATDFLHRRGRFAMAPRPDLILLDLELPKRDGRELLVDIKHDYELRTIPVVVLTASANEDDLDRMHQWQVAGFMTKPVDVEQFLAVVRKLKRYWHSDVILPSCE